MLVEDIEYVIFRHPDLQAARRFMLDYGLLGLEQHGDAVYMRGYGDAPFSCVTTRGEASFIGMGFRVADLAALEALSDRFNSKIELSPRPGGGLRVVGSDPDGRRLEFVFGAARLDPVPLNGAERRDAFANGRHGRFAGADHGPSHVLRLGHVAIITPHPQKLVSWYCDTLGLKPSEPAGNELRAEAARLRLNQQEAWSDHHTLAIVRGVKSGLDHASFECRDCSDVAMGQMFMMEGGYRWDVGRRFHGEQLFDYWTDPAGFRLEHYVDGDLVPRNTPISKYPFSRDASLQ